MAPLRGAWYISPMAPVRSSARALDPAPAAVPEPDPIWAAILDAPLAEEPETDEERAAFDVIEADIHAGRRGLRSAEIAETIEQMRREQGE
jgi:hypothetical protein